MTQSLTEAEVAIVGGGPVGIGLAIDLGQRGVKCTLVERYEQPQQIPKGQNLTPRTMEHFHFWGVEPAVRAARTIPRDLDTGGLVAYGTLLSPYAYDWMQRDLVRSYYFMANERLPQYATEAALRKRASELDSVKTLYGWQAEAVHDRNDAVEILVTDRNTNNQLLIRAQYVIGCDGGHSITRRCAGIAQTRSDHDRLMVLLLFRSRRLDSLLDRFARKTFICVLDPALQGYWKFFGRVDHEGQWFFHAPVPAGTTRDNYDFHRLLASAVGQEFDADIQHIGFWDLRFTTANPYRKGRIFVAGDAAHSHPPYGGYGVNTGLEDARNLGWKLAAVLRGWGGAALLDSYDAERRPVFTSTAAHFIEKAIADDHAFLAAHDPARDRAAFEAAWAMRASGTVAEVNTYEPHYEGSPVVCGPPGAVCSAVGSHTLAARAGHHLAPQLLSSGRNVFEELQNGFNLLCFRDSAVPNAFEKAAAARGIPLKTVRDIRADGSEPYGAPYILVRDDHFVVWAGSEDAADPETVLRRSVGDAAA